jgi:hypothetical protein
MVMMMDTEPEGQARAIIGRDVRIVVAVRWSGISIIVIRVVVVRAEVGDRSLVVTVPVAIVTMAFVSLCRSCEGCAPHGNRSDEQCLE